MNAFFYLCINSTATNNINTYCHTLSLPDALPVCSADVANCAQHAGAMAGGAATLSSHEQPLEHSRRLQSARPAYPARRSARRGEQFARSPEIGRASCRERVCQYV